eukprot:Gb_38514 [translate_table: standard]
MLPKTSLSRCQKFSSQKLKDIDVFNRLQKLAVVENIDIEEDALRLIAIRLDGSLQEAKTTLEQLSLLADEVSLSMVCEMIGLIPHEKLVNSLDFALSADTKNTMKSMCKKLEDSSMAITVNLLLDFNTNKIITVVGALSHLGSTGAVNVIRQGYIIVAPTTDTVVRGIGRDTKQVEDKIKYGNRQRPWMHDLMIGCYKPEGHFGEIDITQLKENLLRINKPLVVTTKLKLEIM